MNPVPLRVSAVAYLNTVPLIWGMLHGPQQGCFDLDFTVPSKCADALRDGQAQAGIIPSIEYQRIDNLVVVPGLSISSSGPVRSVLLISRCPVEQIRSLALDTSSRTSAALLEILLKRYYRISPVLKPREPNLSTMLQECDGALMIGDPALASALPGLHVYDLAEAWHTMTQLPFVFAFWAVRREAASPGLIAPFQQSAAYGLEHVEEIAESENKRTGLPVSLIRTYLTENIDFSLGRANLEGLEKFYSLAQEMGLTSCAKPPEFIHLTDGEKSPLACNETNA